MHRSTAQGTITSRAGRQNYVYGRNDNYNPRNGGNGGNGTNYGNTFEDYSTLPDNPVDGYSEPGNGYIDQSRRPYHPKNAKRTIQLCNLPDGTTHADITNVVRGGMLLDIYLRSNDRCAAVSFLEEEPAKSFFHHVKRNDLYIHGKRVGSSCIQSLMGTNDTRLRYDGTNANSYFQDMVYTLCFLSIRAFPCFLPISHFSFRHHLLNSHFLLTED
jgi:hypothetical protein